MADTGKLTACQARAARAMLTWSIERLAKMSGISESTIRRIENGFDVPEGVTLDMLVRLQEYFESRGFVFNWHEHHGPGVQWGKYPSRQERRRAATGTK